MDEAEILAHLLSRDERGLQAAQERYGARLKGLAQRIAGAETAEECVNDALLASIWGQDALGRVSPPWKTAVSFPRR